MVAMVKAIVAMMTVTVMIIMIDGVVNGGVVLMVEWCWWWTGVDGGVNDSDEYNDIDNTMMI